MVYDPLNSRVMMAELTGEADRRRMDELTGEAMRRQMDKLTGEADRRRMDKLTGEADRRRMDKLTGEADRRRMDKLTGEADRRRMDELTGEAARRRMDELTGEADRRRMDELTGAAARRTMAQLLGERRTRLFEKIVEEQPELRVALLEDEFHDRFVAAIANVRELNDVGELSPATERALRHLLLANIITCLETYLSDALISTIKGDRVFMRKFVETFRDFERRKFSLNEVFTTYDEVDTVAIQALASLTYHDLAKIQGVYRDALGVEFPEDLGHLYRAVLLRHDIVHRNGKNKEGHSLEISSEDVELLATQVSEFVLDVHRQLVEIREGNPNDTWPEAECLSPTTAAAANGATPSLSREVGR